MEDRVHVTLLETSSSLFSSCSCSDGDGVGECVVCLRKFHGGEEIRSQSCGHVFHKSCVDKWILDYNNMTCLFCGLCLVNVPADHDGRHLMDSTNE
jgi:RING/U-box domain-containing protein